MKKSQIFGGGGVAPAMMLMQEATMKNCKEEIFKMKGMVEDAIDSEQKGVYVAPRNAPYGLSNGVAT